MGLPTGLLILVATIAPTVYWIFAIIEVARIPARQFYDAGSNKTFWICVVVFLQIFGALLWLFLRRADVLEAKVRLMTMRIHRRTGTWTRKRERFGGGMASNGQIATTRGPVPAPANRTVGLGPLCPSSAR
jgi:hypothetical protein